MKYFLNLLFHIAFSPHLCQLISCTEYSEEDLPYVEWCEDGGERRRVTADKCQTFPFVHPYPNCYCLSGIAVLSDKQASYDVQFAKRGCFSHKSYGTATTASSQRLIELQAFQFNEDETIVGVLGRKEQNSQDLKWTFKRIPQPEPISSSGSIVIYNGQLIDLNEEYKDGVLYCVQRNTDPELSKLVQRYELDAEIIWISLNDVCDGGNYFEDENLVSLTQLATPDSQSCTPICPEYAETVNFARSKARTPSIYELRSDKLKDAELLNLTRAEENNKIKECKPIPFDLKASHWALNRNILKHSIERAFPDQQTIKKKFKPTSSFKILDLLAKITTKYCRNAKIPRDFLEQSIAYFKIAHEGTRTYEFSEYFSTEKLFTIQKMLRKCLWALESPLYLTSKGCSNPEIFKTYKNESNPQDAVIIKQSVEHQYFDYHVVLDIPWNMLDLANTVCIKGFSGSYRMYHEMEQGIEHLFTPQLRQFWLYPDISSFSSNFYAHLFGPQWMRFARNLEKCVETAYLEMPGMSRLQRPIWLSEGRQGQHGTHVDQICTRRRIDIPLVSENYEIYCGNSNVGEIDWPSENSVFSLTSSEGTGDSSILGNKVEETRIYNDWLWRSESEIETSTSFSVSNGEKGTKNTIENEGTADRPQESEQPEQNEIFIPSPDEKGAESEPLTHADLEIQRKSGADFEPQASVHNYVKTEMLHENVQPINSNADTVISAEVEDTVYLDWLNEKEKRSTTVEEYMDWASHSASEYSLPSPSLSPNDFIPSSSSVQRIALGLSVSPSGDDSDLEQYGPAEPKDIDFDILLENDRKEDMELDRPKDWTKKKQNSKEGFTSTKSTGQGQHFSRQRLKTADGEILVDNEPNRRSSMEASDVKFDDTKPGISGNKMASHSKNATKLKTSDLVKMNMYFPIK